MAISVLHRQTSGFASSINPTITPTVAPTPGSTLLLVIGTKTGENCGGIVQTGATWTLVRREASAFNQLEVWAATNIAHVAEKIRVFLDAAAEGTLAYLELGGASTIHTSNGRTSSTSGTPFPWLGPNIVTTLAGCHLVLALGWFDHTVATSGGVTDAFSYTSDQTGGGSGSNRTRTRLAERASAAADSYQPGGNFTGADEFTAILVAVRTDSTVDGEAEVPTVHLPPERREWFVGPEGLASFWKDEDSVLTYTLNWAAVLGTDTIDTSTWEVEDGSITTASAASTSTTTSIKVSNTGGTLKNTITTDDGQTHVRRIVIKGVRT